MKRTVPVSERLFRYMTALEVAKAERLRYYVCLVCLAPDINGSEIDQSLAGRIARMTFRQLRQTDLAAMLGGGIVGLLLVDADPHALPLVLDRVAGAVRPGFRQFSRGRELISISAGGSCYPVTAGNDEQLFREATGLLHSAREQGGDRLLLPQGLTSPTNSSPALT